MVMNKTPNNSDKHGGRIRSYYVPDVIDRAMRELTAMTGISISEFVREGLTAHIEATRRNLNKPVPKVPRKPMALSIELIEDNW